MQLPNAEDAFLLGYLLEVNRDPSGWSKFMQAVLEHFNLRSCHLMVMNNETQAMRFHIDAGEPVSAEFAAAYVEKYVHSDEIMAAVKNNPIGQFYATNHLPGVDEVYRNAHYREWATPQGIANGAAACVFTDGNWHCIMASNRRADQGPYTKEEVCRLNKLLPFVEKAVSSSFLISEDSKGEQRAKAIVNTFRIPVAVLTEYGELWTMNQEMRNFIQSQSGMYLQEKTLHIENKAKDKLFNIGILQSSKRASGLDMEIQEAESIAINEDTFIGFQELLNQDSDTGSVLLGVLIYVISPKLMTALLPEKLMDLFSLTPSEAQVCYYLMNGFGLKNIATMELKSVYTVREQLNNVFRKTGCSSQVSLMNLLSSIPK